MLCAALLMLSGSARAQDRRAELDSLELIGGRPTLAGEFAATGALLRERGGQLSVVCAGTLVASRVVVTAAHCLAPDSDEPLYFALPEANASMVAVKRQLLHPAYSVQPARDVVLHDIGVAELAATPDTARQELLPVEAPRSGTKVVIVGYGSSQLPVTIAHEQSAGDAEVIALDEYELTIGGSGDQANCTGDSGGPAFYTDASGQRRIIGVVSRAADPDDPCEGDSIYTRIDTHLDFIQDAIEQASAESESTNAGCASAAPTTAPLSWFAPAMLWSLIAWRLRRRIALQA